MPANSRWDLIQAFKGEVLQPCKKYKSSWKIFLALCEGCHVQGDVADITYGYFLIINILWMSYIGI